MKKILIVAAVLVVSFSLQSCLKDKLTRTYTMLLPVYKDKNEVYADIKSNAPKEIKSPGKIFLFGNYIFLNEVNEGVHIIDNADPSNPKSKAFINIPGNLDIAVKGNTLYADLYSDLVVVDISDPLNAKFIKYIPNVFPDRSYSNGFLADNTRIIVDWIKKDTTVKLESMGSNIIYTTGVFAPSASSTNAAAPSVPGISGSMARFTIVNNDLFTINSFSLNTFDINSPNDPQNIATTSLGWNIETIYPFKDKLFIGSNSGVFIYDVSNPASPVAEGQFSHVRSCDPVIADDNTAYVTLHDGTVCQGFDNQMDVMNISSLSSPSLIKTYPMTNPHGLTKDNNLLFICDGRGGLKMFDAADPSKITLKKSIPGIEPYDAIAWNKNLVVVAKDGLYQFDYSNPNELNRRSKLAVTH